MVNESFYFRNYYYETPLKSILTGQNKKIKIFLKYYF